MLYSLVRIRTALACVVAMAVMSVAPAAETAPTTSPSDPRTHEGFVLPNGLTVVVVSDPDTERAAAAVDVDVGSAADPRGREGLAHLLEHMLFLGTDRYPDAREDQAFFAVRAGRRNAYTSYRNTSYYFEVEAGSLEPALDRLARFFVAPLLPPGRIDSERDVVHSEYQAKRRDDSWRVNAALRGVLNPAHPYSRFNVGSRETLADRDGAPIRDDLLQFYHRHYSARRMTLAVLGPQSPDVLKQWVEERFSDIPDHEVEARVVDEPLFAPGTLPVQLDIVPIRERRSMSLRFPVPAVGEGYEAAPMRYLAQLLEDRGPGSLLARLRAHGWAETLRAGIGMDASDEALFSIDIGLTARGLDHVDDIAGTVFAQIGHIRQHGIEAWRFDELRRQADAAFRFRERQAPMRYVSSLARNLQNYPMRDAVRGGSVPERFEPGLIAEYADLLRPDRLLLMVVAPGLDTDRIDPWFDTAYRAHPIAQQRLADWGAAAARMAPELSLPDPNPFLPRDLGVTNLADGTAIPVRLVHEPGLTLWFKKDVSFQAPRVDLYLAVDSAVAGSGPREATLTALYAAMVNDELSERVAVARRAGLEHAVHTRAHGLMMRVSGFRDGQERLAVEVMSTLRQPDLESHRFERRKAALRRQWSNAEHAAPHRRTTAELSRLLLVPRWSARERLEALEDLSLEDLRVFAERLWSGVSVTALAHGGLEADDATRLAERIRDVLLPGTRPAEVARAQVVDLADGRRRVRDLPGEHPGSAVTIYLQGPDRSEESRAILRLLAHMLRPHYFHELRTEQHTGYVVSSAYLPVLETPGLLFSAQSPELDPGEIEARVSAFIDRGGHLLQTLAPGEFERQRAAVRQLLAAGDRRMQDRSNRYWSDIGLGVETFDSREREARALDGIDVDRVRTAYREWLLERGGGWLVVRSSGSDHAAPMADGRDEVITDPVAFQARYAPTPADPQPVPPWVAGDPGLRDAEPEQARDH